MKSEGTPTFEQVRLAFLTARNWGVTKSAGMSVLGTRRLMADVQDHVTTAFVALRTAHNLNQGMEDTVRCRLRKMATEESLKAYRLACYFRPDNAVADFHRALTRFVMDRP